jgi:hypothetical protein
MGTKNTLLDLNDHLFMQLERLNDDELSQEELNQEISRAKAMTGLASQVVGVANAILAATKLNANDETEGRVPRQLIGDQKKLTE